VDGKGKLRPEELPKPPIQLLWALDMDFSPMHPDVWADTDAERWHYYLQLRVAYEDGRDITKRRRGNPEAAKQGMDAMIKKHS